jgi:hypothetical protein
MPSTLIRMQQRRAMRRAVRVECQVVREHDFRLIARLGLDVSPRGLLVLADRPALTGESVVVSFRVPRTARWFDATATIARVAHGRRPRDVGRCFGLRFDALDADADRTLRLALRGVPPPRPQREPRIDYARSIRAAAL